MDFSIITQTLVDWSSSVSKMTRNNSFHCFSFLVSEKEILFIENCIDEDYLFWSTGEKPDYPTPKTLKHLSPEDFAKVIAPYPTHEDYEAIRDKLLSCPEFSIYQAFTCLTYCICPTVEYSGNTYNLLLVCWCKNALAKNLIFTSFINHSLDVLETDWDDTTENFYHSDISVLMFDKAFAESTFSNPHEPIEIITNGVFPPTIESISSVFYESAEATGRIQFIDDTSDNNLDIVLAEPLRLHDSKPVRKLLAVSNKAVLIVSHGEIIGLSKDPIDEGDNTRIVEINGHMKWTYSIGNELQFKSIDGQRCFLFEDMPINSVLEKSFSSYDKKFEDTIRKDMSFKKGAVLVITDAAQKEATRLCSYRRGTAVTPFSIFDHTDVATGLAQIDGALILDENGQCYAFGVILDGETKIAGDPSRGARYNSTKNYIFCKNEEDKKHKYVGIVMSEDGMMNVFDYRTKE